MVCQRVRGLVVAFLSTALISPHKKFLKSQHSFNLHILVVGEPRKKGRWVVFAARGRGGGQRTEDLDKHRVTECGSRPTKATR